MKRKHGKRWLIWLLGFAAIVAHTSIALAATKYWNPSTGLNTLDGNSPTVDGGGVGPYLDFSKYINDGTAAAGDVLILADGTYAGANYIVAPTTSGTAGSKITLKADNPCTPIYTTPLTMKGNGKTCSATIDGQDTRACITMGTQDHWRFEGFEVKQSSTIGILSDGGRTGNEFYNLLVHDCDNSAFDIDQSTDHVIDNCEGYANERDFIKAQGASPWCKRLTVRMNWCHGNFDDFITLSTSDTGSDFTIIEMNRADYQFGLPVGDPFHSDGVEVANATRLIIRNNIISDFTIPINLSGFNGQEQTLQDVWVYGNIFWNDRRFSETGSGMAPLFIDSRSDRNDIVQRVYVFWNSYGFAGANDNAVAWIGDGTETTIADNVIRNELFFDCRDDATKKALDISATYTSGVSTDYHIYWNTSDTLEANSISGDPLLVGYTGKTSAPNFNFAVRFDSPAIDAGDPALTTSISGFGTAIPTGYTDVAGTVRKLNGGTMGALEYAGSRLLVIEKSFPRGINRGINRGF